MENLLGKIEASLIEKDQSLSEELIDRINDNIAPPKKVAAGDVYIRAMYIVSDKVNSFGGCFPSDEHDRLMELIIDSPVLVGHRKDSLPIARNFHAERVRKGDTNWVKVYFYWLRGCDKAEQLRSNIDGGIYKECSISFIFGFPECSICGDDIRRCGHQPFTRYQTSDRTKREAFFNYRQIDKVLETSLVYRGSVQDTSLTDELFFHTAQGRTNYRDTKKATWRRFKRIWHIKSLKPGRKYALMPAYEARRLVIESDHDKIIGKYYNGQMIESEVWGNFIRELNLQSGTYRLDARLIGYRGKERQPISELHKYLSGKESSVTRIDLKIYDLIGRDSDNAIGETWDSRRQELEKLMSNTPDMLAPYAIGDWKTIEDALSDQMTKYGAEIVSLDSDRRYLYVNTRRAPFIVRSKEASKGGYKYGLAIFNDNSNLPVINYLHSRCDINIGEIAEVSVSAIQRGNEGIKLIHPQLIDSYVCLDEIDSLELLLKESFSGQLRIGYSVFKLSKDDVVLQFNGQNTCEGLLVRKFSVQGLISGRRFLADRYDLNRQATGDLIGQGEVLNISGSNQMLKIQLEGWMKGILVLRPVVLNRRHRLLMHKLNPLDSKMISDDNKSNMATT